MMNDQLPTVTRTVALDASVDEVWRLLTDEAELSQWFSGAVSFEPVPGGVGRFVEGDTVRRAVVHHVEHGRRIGFTWWDERRPAEASTVELAVDASSVDGRVQLTVTETVGPPAGGVGLKACSWIDAADVADVFTVAGAWDGRLGMIADRLAVRCSPLAR